MEEKEFVALVDELEGYARENPGAYNLRVTVDTFTIRARRVSRLTGAA